MDDKEISYNSPTKTEIEQHALNSAKTEEITSSRTILSNEEPLTTRHPLEDDYDGVERQATYIVTAKKNKSSKCCLFCFLLSFIVPIFFGGVAAGLYFNRCHLGIINTYFPSWCPSPATSISSLLNATFVPLSQSLMIQHKDFSVDNTFAYVLQPIVVTLNEDDTALIDLSNISLAVMESNITSNSVPVVPLSPTSFLFTVPLIAAGPYQFKLNLAFIGENHYFINHTITVFDLPLTHYTIFDSLDVTNATSLTLALDAVMSPLNLTSTERSSFSYSNLSKKFIDVASLSTKSELLLQLETYATEAKVIADSLDIFKHPSTTSGVRRRLDSISDIQALANRIIESCLVLIACLIVFGANQAIGLLAGVLGIIALKQFWKIMLEKLQECITGIQAQVDLTSTRRLTSSGALKCGSNQVTISLKAGTSSTQIGPILNAEYPSLYHAMNTLMALLTSSVTSYVLKGLGVYSYVSDIKSALSNPSSGVVTLSPFDVTVTPGSPAYCSISSDLNSIDCDCARIPSGETSVEVDFDVALNGYPQPASAQYTTTTIKFTLTPTPPTSQPTQPPATLAPTPMITAAPWSNIPDCGGEGTLSVPSDYVLGTRIPICKISGVGCFFGTRTYSACLPLYTFDSEVQVVCVSQSDSPFGPDDPYGVVCAQICDSRPSGMTIEKCAETGGYLFQKDCPDGLIWAGCIDSYTCSAGYGCGGSGPGYTNLVYYTCNTPGSSCSIKYRCSNERV